MATISLESLTITEGCAILVLLVVLYTIGTVIYELFISPLASVPGPKLYAISQLPLLYRSYHGIWSFTLKELHDKYGPVVRVSPTDISMITPDVWKELYSPKSRPGEFERDRSFRLLGRGGTGIADEDIAEHTRHRRMLSHAFSENALRGQEGIMQRLVDMLISGLKLHVKEHGPEPVNMTMRYNWTTFDVVVDLAFGKPFGCLEAQSTHYVISMINDLFYYMVRTQPFKRFPLLGPFQHLLGSPSDAIPTIKFFEKFALETIKSRIDSGDTGRKDFMSYILAHNNKKEFTDGELTSNSSTLLLAGSETTATTLTAGTYFLLKNPSVYQRLVQEIRSAFKEEKDITISKLDNLPYLVAVLTETLRIFPPVPGIMSRTIPKGGQYLCGYWFPERTIVSVSQFSAYHSERYFSRAEEFIPTRWIHILLRTQEIMARAEMRLIMAKILWNFDLELSPEYDSWEKGLRVYGLWSKGPLMVKLKPVERS
ncbi:averantin oxidoreductase [Nannizzia gypsea CBS 118893]|uniref:Averantin oxidoreductase n=1 Tax=Arthroderma gypseum (strain ATCC MYA-4604 / CBS 118893) TaxID=535722 RepID=E4USR0_ARTGP|nr:averantin oxidoreductase [Nannizzia gypsea CBS 118893]EFR00575.1 averantin oxidoreductase [Nannizzia gypsea CBS 118893]